MARKSAAALSTMTPAGPAIRPDPPDELNKLEAEVWVAIVNRMPSGHFPDETHGLLLQYCRHTIRARQVAERLAAGELDDRTFMALSKLEAVQTNAIAILASRMRLTQSSTDDRSKRKPPPTEKPWQATGTGQSPLKPWESVNGGLSHRVDRGSSTGARGKGHR